MTLAAKFFFWPLAVWLAATRRVAAAVLACALGLGLLSSRGPLLALRDADYPTLRRRPRTQSGRLVYGIHVALDARALGGLARALWLAIGLGVLLCVVLLGRRGDERSAFIAAIGARSR